MDQSRLDFTKVLDEFLGLYSRGIDKNYDLPHFCAQNKFGQEIEGQ
jgi:hypothetical protein